MFQSIDKTDYPPTNKPLMIYDGNCGFCKYWIIKWKKISAGQIDYIAYQRSHQQFKDIDVSHFKEAVRLIDTDGKVYNGPDAAFMTYYLKGKVPFLHQWYNRFSWFRIVADKLYQWIADHRSILLKVSMRLFGKSARKPQNHWVKYIIALLAILLSLVCVYIANSAKQ